MSGSAEEHHSRVEARLKAIRDIQLHEAAKSVLQRHEAAPRRVAGADPGSSKHSARQQDSHSIAPAISTEEAKRNFDGIRIPRTPEDVRKIQEQARRLRGNSTPPLHDLE